MVESGRGPGKGRFRASKICPDEHRKTVPASTGKWTNLSEYRKMAESGRASKKGIIRASIEKLFDEYHKKGSISVSTEKC